MNGTSTGKKTSNGSTSGSVTGEKSQVGDKNRERRRGAERKEGDRKEGDRPTRGPGGERRDRGGRERDPNSKVHMPTPKMFCLLISRDKNFSKNYKTSEYSFATSGIYICVWAVQLVDEM